MALDLDEWGQLAGLVGGALSAAYWLGRKLEKLNLTVEHASEKMDDAAESNAEDHREIKKDVGQVRDTIVEHGERLAGIEATVGAVCQAEGDE